MLYKTYTYFLELESKFNSFVKYSMGVGYFLIKLIKSKLSKPSYVFHYFFNKFFYILPL